VVLPQLSEQERKAAAEAALVARRRRAAVKKELADGQIGLAEVFDLGKVEPAVAKMRVSDLLAAMPRIGPVRAQAIMEQSDIAASRRLRGLGERQRLALLAYFEGM
jgi:hypothetical protein